eukprot:357381-Pleurochrysis_carterae.AAC.2
MRARIDAHSQAERATHAIAFARAHRCWFEQFERVSLSLNTSHTIPIAHSVLHLYFRSSRWGISGITVSAASSPTTQKSAALLTGRVASASAQTPTTA